MHITVYFEIFLKYSLSPAMESGLEVGDQILYVNDSCLQASSHMNAIRNLKAAGTHVILTVHRYIIDEETSNVSIIHLLLSI